MWIGDCPQRPRLLTSLLQIGLRQEAMVDHDADESLDVCRVAERRQHVAVPDPVDVQCRGERVLLVTGRQRQPARLVAADRPSHDRAVRRQRPVPIHVVEEVQFASARLHQVHAERDLVEGRFLRHPAAL